MKDDLEISCMRAELAGAIGEPEQRLAELFDKHYATLHRLADRVFAGEPADASLNPTALVHEAFLRFLDQPAVSNRDTLFFRACFARQCRRILVERARAHRALRRGGGRQIESLTGQEALGITNAVGVLEIHEAIERLARFDARMARIADLRLFAGMTIAECAAALDVSERTVVKDWSFAQSFLQRELR